MRRINKDEVKRKLNIIYMNNIIINNKQKIEDMIYEIRGRQVILDRNLSKLYHTETRFFMQSVKRNIKRFPDNFMFQLTN